MSKKSCKEIIYNMKNLNSTFKFSINRSLSILYSFILPFDQIINSLATKTGTSMHMFASCMFATKPSFINVVHYLLDLFNVCIINSNTNMIYSLKWFIILSNSEEMIIVSSIKDVLAI